MQRYGDWIVIWIVFTFFVVFSALTFTFNARAQVAPLFIGSVGLVWTILRIYNMVKASKSNATSNEEEAKEVFHGRKVIISFLWLFGFLGAMYIFGYLIAAPIFLFLFQTLYGKEKWTTSLVITVITTVIIYILFDLLLGVQLPKSQLF